jgi:hypothetical protein
MEEQREKTSKNKRAILSTPTPPKKSCQEFFGNLSIQSKYVILFAK